MRLILSLALVLAMACPAMASGTITAARDKVTGHVWITHPAGSPAAANILDEAQESGLDPTTLSIEDMTQEQIEAQRQFESGQPR